MFEILARASPLNPFTTIVLKSIHQSVILLMVQTTLESLAGTKRMPFVTAATIAMPCKSTDNHQRCMFAKIIALRVGDKVVHNGCFNQIVNGKVILANEHLVLSKKLSQIISQLITIKNLKNK